MVWYGALQASSAKHGYNCEKSHFFYSVPDFIPLQYYKEMRIKTEKNKERNQNIALIEIWLFGSHNLGHDI